MINEDNNRNLVRILSTIIILNRKFSTSTPSNEVVQNEEEEKSSTQSIRIEDSLLAVTPSFDAPKFHEIYDISSPHMDEIEE